MIYTAECRWPMSDVPCRLPATDDKSIEDCKARFDDMKPFVGHPDVPPREG